MMYAYITLSDDTEITHSHLLERNGQEKVEVHFERPTEQGFDTARCVLPSYEWIVRKGYSDEEIQEFDELMRDNAHLFYRYAKSGGLKFA